MEIIKKLSDMIEDEIKDAEKYAKCALNHEWDNRDLGDLFYKLSNEEMGHMSMLHDAVVKIIKEYREEKGEPPTPMMKMYEILHQQHIDHAAAVKALQGMYKR